MKKRIYSLYKGEEWIKDGTRKELAEYLGVKERTITFYGTPTYAKRGKKENSKRKAIIYVGKEEV